MTGGGKAPARSWRSGLGVRRSCARPPARPPFGVGPARGGWPSVAGRLGVRPAAPL